MDQQCQSKLMSIISAIDSHGFTSGALQVSSLLRAQWSQLVERYVHHPQVATNCGRITSVGGCFFWNSKVLIRFFRLNQLDRILLNH